MKIQTSLLVIFSHSELTEVSLPLYRSDKTLQDIVYKLVPGLFKSKNATVKQPLHVALALFTSTLCWQIFSRPSRLAISLIVIQLSCTTASTPHTCEDIDINKTLMKPLEVQIHHSVFQHGCTVVELLISTWEYVINPGVRTLRCFMLSCGCFSHLLKDCSCLVLICICCW